MWKGFIIGVAFTLSIAYPAAAKAIFNTAFDVTHYYVTKVMEKVAEIDVRIVPKNITGHQIEAPVVEQIAPTSEPFAVESQPEGLAANPSENAVMQGE